MLVEPWLAATSLVVSLPMGMFLTKRRAVDLCRVATCLCCPVRWTAGLSSAA
ncbi:Ms5788A family Cys-rich leader peptide [Salinispora fenicalii]|uniref:Ms5788A family Cys-rich leader peptide n=1 Tax=Salinispora fenicalii TaxID=1137263 RepID=UPI00037283DE|nr:Ms5788A family Cys-rich leader peptide [Salinispora fenicalii]